MVMFVVTGWKDWNFKFDEELKNEQFSKNMYSVYENKLDLYGYVEDEEYEYD